MRPRRVQAGLAAAPKGLPCAFRPKAAGLLPAGLAALLLAGCASVPDPINPVSWWHSLQGGAIAEQRPPPPGATDPYPNLASVPAKPAQPDRAALRQITDSLVADRLNAQHEAAAAPLADPSSPSASPALFGTGSAPPPGAAPPPGPAKVGAAKPGAPAAGTQAAGTPPAGAPSESPAASASMPAAPAPAPPPAPAAPPAKAPVGSVASTPLAPPGDAVTADSAPAAPPPAIAAAPPAPPALPGVAPPAEPAPPAPVLGAKLPPAKLEGNAVTVPFESGSALLPPSADGPLKQLAAKRGKATIAVVGYGDATEATPDAQSTALTLGLARAQAMAAALAASGVPPDAVEIAAQATGRGGSARLVQ